MAKKSQQVKVSISADAEFNIKVTDVYDNPVMNYTWCLQGLSLETAEKLLVQLQKAVSIGKQIASQD